MTSFFRMAYPILELPPLSRRSRISPLAAGILSNAPSNCLTTSVAEDVFLQAVSIGFNVQLNGLTLFKCDHDVGIERVRLLYADAALRFRNQILQRVCLANRKTRSRRTSKTDHNDHSGHGTPHIQLLSRCRSRVQGRPGSRAAWHQCVSSARLPPGSRMQAQIFSTRTLSSSVTSRGKSGRTPRPSS
jgi:hypothetical protein